jgi:redox-sensitive bicupin YhaK (pirin superfamily)
MITLRKADDRGRTDIGWLQSRHSFSFGDYWDEANQGFRTLRVINDDIVAPGQGFGTHGHRDMEIITWVLAGELQHRDSLGNGDVIRPGDVQRMSAGTGIRHSEFNPSATQPVHLLQIWIEPDRRGLPPSYEQVQVPAAQRQDRWRRIADGQGRDGALRMGADASVLATLLAPGKSVSHGLAPGRHAWLHVATGRVRLGDLVLGAGDAVAVSGEPAVAITAEAASEALLFDLP